MDVTGSIVVPISTVFADYVWNCRGLIPPHSVKTLESELKKDGLLQAVIVIPYNDLKRPEKKFKLIAGFRRFTAITNLKWEMIEVKVKEVSEIEARLLNLKENIDRQDLNIKQEADGIAHFKRAGWTQLEVARRLSQSTGWVAVRFLLLELEEDIQMVAAAGLLNQEQIKAIAALAPGEGRYAAVRSIKEAKARGEKADLEFKGPKTKVKNALKRKARAPREIFPFIENIIDNVGAGLASRAMAWCAGEVSDIELMRDIKAECEKLGRKYEAPETHSHIRI